MSEKSRPILYSKLKSSWTYSITELLPNDPEKTFMLHGVYLFSNELKGTGLRGKCIPLYSSI